MVIVQIWGGLGNQMFQYALHVAYLQKNITSKLDIQQYKKDFAFNGYELERIFNLQADYVYNPQRNFIKLSAKLLHRIKKTPYRETDGMFGYYLKEIADLKFGFIKGYWQTEKYFNDCAHLVRKKFTFPLITDEKNVAILKKINDCNAVSIHIRRGDYLLNNRNWEMSIDHYYKAIDHIKQQVADPHFFIFSDDIAWAKEHITESATTFIDWNKGEKSYVDMQLMSSCKHNVIANSSFSWWGAWLNDHPGKIVIAPDKWLPFFEGTRDVIPNGWIKLH